MFHPSFHWPWPQVAISCNYIAREFFLYLAHGFPFETHLFCYNASGKLCSFSTSETNSLESTKLQNPQETTYGQMHFLTQCV